MCDTKRFVLASVTVPLPTSIWLREDDLYRHQTKWPSDILAFYNLSLIVSSMKPFIGTSEPPSPLLTMLKVHLMGPIMAAYYPNQLSIFSALTITVMRIRTSFHRKMIKMHEKCCHCRSWKQYRNVPLPIVVAKSTAG